MPKAVTDPAVSSNVIPPSSILEPAVTLKQFLISPMKLLYILFLTIIAPCSYGQEEEIFRSAAHHFRLVYPPNWTHKTIKDPNVVTKGDRNGVYINVSVARTPDGETPNAHGFSKADVLDMLNEQSSAPELVSFEKQFIDSVPAMMVVFKNTNKTLDLTFKTKSVVYFFYKDKKLFVITGGTEEKDFESKLMIIRKIIGSFKFEDHLYK